MTANEMLERMAKAATGEPDPHPEDCEMNLEIIQLALRELVDAHTEGDLIDYHNVGLDVLAITELVIEVSGAWNEE